MLPFDKLKILVAPAVLRFSMSHNEKDQKRRFFSYFFSHCLERIAKSKTFPLLMKIAVTTSSVDKKPFLCHVPSTKTSTSMVFSIPRSLEETSDILFSASCLDVTFIK